MAQRLVLVNLGVEPSCPYSRVKFDVEAMDRAELLAALADSRLFTHTLRDVRLDKCTIHVCASASDEEPSAGEARTARELRGGRTLGALAADLEGRHLFVHVRLPAAVEHAGAGGEWERAAVQLLRSAAVAAQRSRRVPRRAATIRKLCARSSRFRRPPP